jgi:hypothetical protein
VLHRQGRDVRPEAVKHVAPFGWKHIELTRDYVWSSVHQPADGSFRSLRRNESMLGLGFLIHFDDTDNPRTFVS